MSNKLNQKLQTDVHDTGESESIRANCLICGCDIVDDDNVLPLLCIEGEAIGFWTVVCEKCVDKFDERIVAAVNVGIMPMPKESGKVM